MPLPFDKTNDKQVQEVLIRKARQLSVRNNRDLCVSVGMIGILGFIFLSPIVIGIFAGEWLDKKMPISHISWQLILMALGFVLGCFNAYLWVKKEGIEKVDASYRKEQELITKGQSKDE